MNYNYFLENFLLRMYIIKDHLTIDFELEQTLLKGCRFFYEKRVPRYECRCAGAFFSEGLS